MSLVVKGIVVPLLLGGCELVWVCDRVVVCVAGWYECGRWGAVGQEWVVVVSLVCMLVGRGWGRG
jgi:hypothetical protein